MNQLDRAIQAVVEGAGPGDVATVLLETGVHDQANCPRCQAPMHHDPKDRIYECTGSCGYKATMAEMEEEYGAFEQPEPEQTIEEVDTPKNPTECPICHAGLTYNESEKRVECTLCAYSEAFNPTMPRHPYGASLKGMGIPKPTKAFAPTHPAPGAGDDRDDKAEDPGQQHSSTGSGGPKGKSADQNRNESITCPRCSGYLGDALNNLAICQECGTAYNVEPQYEEEGAGEPAPFPA